MLGVGAGATLLAVLLAVGLVQLVSPKRPPAEPTAPAPPPAAKDTE
jgi:hypothetical protein